MSAPTTLLFGVHAHQPAGNFTEVMDHAHERCYRPFLETLHRYPAFRFSAHFSGPLLDYLAGRYPRDMQLLADMAARGQVELFGAGDTEPVLAAIPSRDRVGQIGRLSEKLQARFGQQPRGAWLTERVWESTVVPALVDCGIRYVTVDDYHFLCAGLAPGELGGYYSTEEDGRRLDLFPISEALRYRFPFAPSAEAVGYLERLGGGAAVYFDDIEKFGIWPETYDWVYGKRWLEQFIEGVLASPLLATQTFETFHASQRTRGVVYLPTVSYVEMNEWSLPASAAATYNGLRERAASNGRGDVEKPFLRGGIWKNFVSRYPEANWMHKRMLALSSRLDTVPARQRSEAMLEQLYAAQANDAYWHGLFGGLYLPHLRRSVYRNLVGLEAALDRVAPRAPASRADVDLDGNDELFLQNGMLQAVVRLDGSASVVELDDYLLRQNFGDTLRRHAEHYHAKIGAAANTAAATGIASAHDRVSFKHAIAPADAEPDAEAQSMLRDGWTADGAATMPILKYREDWSAQEGLQVRFVATLESGATIEKRLSLDGRRLEARYALAGLGDGEFHTLISLAMPSCDGVGGRIVHEGRIVGGFGQPFDADPTGEVVLEDLFMQGSVTVRAQPPARVTTRAYRTVSQSEEGFERIMQAVELVIAWRVSSTGAALAVSLETATLPTPAQGVAP